MFLLMNKIMIRILIAAERWGVFPYFELFIPGNRDKGKGNGAGLPWESQSHCFADELHTLLVQKHNMTTVKEIAEQSLRL